MASRKREGAGTTGSLRGSPKPRSRKVAAAGAAAVVVIAALALVVFWPWTSQADLHPVAGQNILLITIDTLRADALGASGGSAATPALDALAADGVRFDFAHAHAVMTLTSHASILTGEYPFRHGLRDNSGYRLPRDARTAASLLKQAGYTTAAFVAAFPLHSRFGLNLGFDLYDDHFGQSAGPADFNMSERPATAVVALARKWIGERTGRSDATIGPGPKTQPWFVWVHVFEPHAPYRPPAPFDAQYASNPYYGEVAAADAALAPLIDDARHAPRPTLVIVTGDHGEGLGEHGETAHGIFAYESTLRVPLIIAELGGGAPTTPSVPSATHRRAGEVSSVAARHVDILPTILDAVGQPVPADLPGRTLLPDRERRPGAPPRTTYFEAMSGMLNHGWAPLTGVLIGRDKLIDVPIIERYNLAADSAEQTNLAGRAPEKDRMLAEALGGFGPVPPGPRITEDRDATARLRALGYVSADMPRKQHYTDADDPKRLIEIDAALHKAIDAFAEGRLEEAAQIYRQVIDRRPDMAFPYRRLAVIEWQRGNADGAIAILRAAVAHGVTDSRALTQLGEYLSDSGRLAEGIRILEPLAENPAAEPDTVNVLAIASARSGRTEDARRGFERLLDMLPESSAPIENLGVLALGRGDLAAAKKYFDRAVAVDPNSSKAHAGVGTTAIQKGDRVGAYEAWTRAVELDPTNWEAVYNLGVSLARDGRMDAARPYLEQFLRGAPSALLPNEMREVSRLLQPLK